MLGQESLVMLGQKQRKIEEILVASFPNIQLVTFDTFLVVPEGGGMVTVGVVLSLEIEGSP